LLDFCRMKVITLQDVAVDIRKTKREWIEWNQEFYAADKRNKALKEALNRFNPEVDVIISRRELEALDALKSVAGIAEKVESISEGVDYIKSRYTKATAEEKAKSMTKSDKSERRKSKWLLPKS
jgi:hypothetical protein